MKLIKLTKLMNKIKDKLLLASVFVTGAAVLIIEIIAIRILSPYFGNTIYTTSSVIGTILAALSLGYYLGGMLSDKYPYHRFFYGIILISGFLIIFMGTLDNAVLSLFELLFPITIGPLISSIVIFFIPAFLLGMLSPFAIKLHKKDQFKQLDQDKIGSQSGEVFFWSTIGSIAGSLLAGFVFIPYFGINSIIIGTGIILSLWGIFGFLFLGPIDSDLKSTESFKWNQDKKTLALMILLFLSELLLLFFYFPRKQPNIVYEKDGVYEKIKIFDDQWNNQPARFLLLDKSWSSATYLNSDELAFEYSKYYRLYKLFNSKAKNAFFIGGGAYSIPKAFLADSPEMQVDVAEIEPSLFFLAKEYFDFPNTDRLINYTEDGRRFLNKNQKKYDIIAADVYYSFFSMPIHLTTKEFFSLAKNRLSDKGVFIGNFAGDLNKEAPSFILSEIKTFRSVFTNSYFFSVESVNTSNSQNVIFLGINSQEQIDFRADEILESSDPIIKNLHKKNIDLNQFDFSKYQEITDDFSPVEYYVSQLINHWYR